MPCLRFVAVRRHRVLYGVGRVLNGGGGGKKQSDPRLPYQVETAAEQHELVSAQIAGVCSTLKTYQALFAIDAKARIPRLAALRAMDAKDRHLRIWQRPCWRPARGWWTTDSAHRATLCLPRLSSSLACRASVIESHWLPLMANDRRDAECCGSHGLSVCWSFSVDAPRCARQR